MVFRPALCWDPPARVEPMIAYRQPRGGGANTAENLSPEEDCMDNGAFRSFGGCAAAGVRRRVCGKMGLHAPGEKQVEAVDCR